MVPLDYYSGFNPKTINQKRESKYIHLLQRSDYCMSGIQKVF